MTDDVVGTVLDRLDRVRRTGKGWSARCPAHEDRDPSLSIAEGADGQVLLYCHAGCALEDVVRALRLELSDLFEHDGAPHRPPRKRTLLERVEQAIDEGTDDLPPETAAEDVAAWLQCPRGKDDSDDKDGGERGGSDADPREIRLALAELTDEEYEPFRRNIAQLSGWRVSAVDKLREKAKQELRKLDRVNGPGSSNGSGAFADVEPWPDPVDGAKLLASIARCFAAYVVLPEGAVTALALWVVFAHAHGAFEVSPLLAITSPEKRCGKTTVLMILGRLVPRSLPASNVTPAALFRAVDKWNPTLVIDEADSFLQEREELRGILNSGHHRANAFVIRCEGEDHEPRQFSTWGAKAVALIGRLPETLEDRSIEVRMRRKSILEQVQRLRLDSLDVEDLARQAARWVSDHLCELRSADPEVPEGLGDRAADNWRCLVTIADVAGAPWPERAREAATLLHEMSGRDESSVGTMLLVDLRNLFRRQGAERLASQLIVQKLAELEERPWPEWRHGNPITTRQLARLMGPFGVKPKQLRKNDEKVRGYERGDLEEAWERYAPEEGSYTHTGTYSSGTSGTSGTDHAQPTGLVPDVPDVPLERMPSANSAGKAAPNTEPAQADAEWSVSL